MARIAGFRIWRDLADPELWNVWLYYDQIVTRNTLVRRHKQVSVHTSVDDAAEQVKLVIEFDPDPEVDEFWDDMITPIGEEL